MRARMFVLLSMAAVSLWGCDASAPGSTSKTEVVVRPGSTSMTCSTLACTVTVTVGPSCAISTDGDTLTVKVPDEKEVTVTWQLRLLPGATGTLASNGVDGKNGDWQSEFKTPGPGSTQFSWVNKNKQKKKPFGYNVFISQGTVTCRYDPFIINDY